MRILLSLLLFSIFHFPFSLGSQPFVKPFGDTLITETGIAAIQTKKGFIYYAGTITDTATSRTDMAFIKMDNQGNVIWTKKFGTVNSDYCNDMTLMPDSTFLLTGYTFDYSNSNADWMVIKADTAGNLVWMKTHTKTNTGEAFNDAEITSDLGFIACGYITDTTGGTGNNSYLVKFDAAGNRQWHKAYGTALNDYGMSVKQTPGGDYVFSADHQLASSIYNVMVIKTDASGNQLWNTPVVSPYNSGCKRFIITSTGDYLVAGESATASSSKFDAYFVKLNSSGAVYWKRYIGNLPEAEAAFNLFELPGNLFVAAGYGQVNSAGKTKVLLLAIDSAANELYRKYYGNYLVNMGYNISPSITGGFLIAGMCTGPEDQYLLIADSLPSNVGVAEPMGLDISAYPNPVRSLLTLNGWRGGGQLQVFDLVGRKVLAIDGWQGQPVNFSLLNAGVYFVRIADHAQAATIRVVKE